MDTLKSCSTCVKTYDMNVASSASKHTTECPTVKKFHLKGRGGRVHKKLIFFVALPIIGLVLAYLAVVSKFIDLLEKLGCNV